MLTTRDQRGNITTFADDNAGQLSSFTDTQGRNNGNVLAWTSAGKQLFNRSYAWGNRTNQNGSGGPCSEQRQLQLRHGESHAPVLDIALRQLETAA